MDFFDWLVPIVPFLLIALLMPWLMRRSSSMQKWEQLQQRQIELLEQQNKTLAEVSEQLKRLASQR